MGDIVSSGIPAPGAGWSASATSPRSMDTMPSTSLGSSPRAVTFVSAPSWPPLLMPKHARPPPVPEAQVWYLFKGSGGGGVIMG